MKDGFKHKRKKISKVKIEMIIDKFIDVLYKVMIITLILFMVYALVMEMYVLIEYGDTPISEVPAWAYWWLQFGGD